MSWSWIITLVAACSAMVIVSAEHNVTERAKAQLADLKTLHARDEVKRIEVTLERERQITQERNKAQSNANKQLAQARSDAASADAAAERLRLWYGSAAASGGATAGAVGNGTGQSPSPLQADVFAKVLVLARQYVDTAESAITSGEQCAAEYDAVKGK